MRRKTTTPATPPDDSTYPTCETTLWQIGQWRCVYWRPAGEWGAASIRLFRAERLVRTAAFGLAASKQSSEWRLAVQARPDQDPL